MLQKGSSPPPLGLQPTTLHWAVGVTERAGLGLGPGQPIPQDGRQTGGKEDKGHRQVAPHKGLSPPSAIGETPKAQILGFTPQ